ncbi:hypothetical protein J2S09_000242 [Bacillus fengqiuensis]|nr:hypothetical protein [Bacillus fengqiuensis]
MSKEYNPGLSNYYIRNYAIAKNVLDEVIKIGAFIFVLVVFPAAFLVYFLYLRRKNEEAPSSENSVKLTIHGHVRFADGIDSDIVSRIELYNDKIMINKAAIIPLARIEKAEYSKVTKKETDEDGKTLNRHFGHLKIEYINKNRQASFIQCETPRPNQYHFMSQYENMKITINNLIGFENQTSAGPAQEPYEL